MSNGAKSDEELGKGRLMVDRYHETERGMLDAVDALMLRIKTAPHEEARVLADVACDIYTKAATVQGGA